MEYYIFPIYADIVRLNQIMFDAYCFDSATQQWIFPFSEGTTCYYNVDSGPWKVDQRLLDAPTNPSISTIDQTWINTVILPAMLDENQAITAGWITIPPPPG